MTAEKDAQSRYPERGNCVHCGHRRSSHYVLPNLATGCADCSYGQSCVTRRSTTPAEDLVMTAPAEVHVVYSYDQDGDEFAESCHCPKTYDHDEEGYRYEQ